MLTLEPPRGWCAAGEEPWAACGLSRRAMAAFLHRAAVAVSLRGEVSVLLAGDATLRRLNRDFRGKNKATDVLSFPSAAPFADHTSGDLAISLETAGRQAAAHGHSLCDEVKVLLLHGLLHLSGLDHEADNGEMAARESVLRKTLRLPQGLTERAGAAARGKRAAR